MSVMAIAERAGVSVATVSRVLNNNPRVNPATARLVREVVRELNYDMANLRRGPRVRGQLNAKVLTLGVIAVGPWRDDEWVRDPVYMAAVAGLTRAAGARGARVLMDEMVDAGAGLCPAVRERAVDGALVFVHSDTDPGLLEELCHTVPVVRMMGEMTVCPGVDQIRSDHLRIGQLAYEYLRGLGCGRAAYVTTRPEHEVFVLREMGFAMAAARTGGTVPAMYVTGRSRTGVLGGPAVRAMAGLEEVADAIALEVRHDSAAGPMGLFVSQDKETIGLYGLLAARGVAPGRDVRVVSCNNEESVLSMLSPRPASIEIGLEEMAWWAVDRLMGRIARPGAAPVRVLVTPRVVEGSYA